MSGNLNTPGDHSAESPPQWSKVVVIIPTALTTRLSRSLVLIGILRDGHHRKTQGLCFFFIFFLILSEIKCIAV